MARATSEASSLFRGNNVMNLVASSEVWPITSNLFSVAGKTVLIYGWIARDRLYDGESIRRKRRSCFHQAGKGSANF
jgi:hypothetical protein